MDHRLASMDEQSRHMSREYRATLKEQVGIKMDLKTFQEKVEKGEISDDTGMAELLINGKPSSFHIHIDRRCLTKSDGTLITHVGLMKMYRPEELTILYKKRPKQMMSINQYKNMMRERDKRQGKTSWI